MSDQDGGLEEARAQFIRGELDGALVAARACLAAAKAAGDMTATGRARTLCGEIAYDRLRYPEARDELKRAVTELESSGADENDVRYARASLGIVLHTLDDVDGATAQLAQVDPDPAAGPAEDLTVAHAGRWIVLAVLHQAFGGTPRARAILERLLAVMPDSDSDSDDARRAARATAHLQLAATLQTEGANAAAIENEERCVELRTSLWGPTNVRVLMAKLSLAQLLLASGRTDDACPLARDAMATLEAIGRADDPRASVAHATLGLVELTSGDVAAGAKRLERACAIEEKTFGGASPRTAKMLVMLAQVEATRQQWGRVMGLCKKMIPALRGDARSTDAYLSACGLDCTAHIALGRAAAGADRLRDALANLDRRGAAFSEELRRMIAELWLLLGRTEIATGRRSGVSTLERARALAMDCGASDILDAATNDLEHVRRGGGMGLKSTS
ncbi:MAG: hypothetical protein KIT84_18670 [Labilithrix sp.]|nr:hypothetical protein [Labilithrix sp.]MCW5813058.1 hypothetical protein [Labilithrix sp.]